MSPPYSARIISQNLSNRLLVPPPIWIDVRASAIVQFDADIVDFLGARPKRPYRLSSRAKSRAGMARAAAVSLCIAEATASAYISRMQDGPMQTEAEMSKTLLTAIAFLFVAAAPAFAQSYNPEVTTGNITQWYDEGNHLHPNPSPNAGVPYPYSVYGGVPVYRPRARVRYRRTW